MCFISVDIILPSRLFMAMALAKMHFCKLMRTEDKALIYHREHDLLPSTRICPAEGYSPCSADMREQQQKPRREKAVPEVSTQGMQKYTLNSSLKFIIRYFETSGCLCKVVFARHNRADLAVCAHAMYCAQCCPKFRSIPGYGL